MSSRKKYTIPEVKKLAKTLIDQVTDIDDYKVEVSYTPMMSGLTKKAPFKKNVKIIFSGTLEIDE